MNLWHFQENKNVPSLLRRGFKIGIFFSLQEFVYYVQIHHVKSQNIATFTSSKKKSLCGGHQQDSHWRRCCGTSENPGILVQENKLKMKKPMYSVHSCCFSLAHQKSRALPRPQESGAGPGAGPELKSLTHSPVPFWWHLPASWMKPYCGFDFRFFDGSWCWTSLRVCLGHSATFFCKVPMRVCCLFLNLGSSFWLLIWSNF